MGRGDSVKRGGRFERAGGRLTLNPRAEPAEWGARKASRRSSVAARTKSPGGTTRQYSARDHRECTRDVRYFASPRLASPPFSFRFASKSEFLYRRAHTRIRVIYVDIGEKNQFVRSFLLDILILPSLFLLALCLLYLRKPTHCSVQRS